MTERALHLCIFEQPAANYVIPAKAGIQKKRRLDAESESGMTKKLQCTIDMTTRLSTLVKCHFK